MNELIIFSSARLSLKPIGVSAEKVQACGDGWWRPGAPVKNIDIAKSTNLFLGGVMGDTAIGVYRFL